MFELMIGSIAVAFISFISVFIKICSDEKKHRYKMNHPEIYGYDYEYRKVN